MKGEIKGTTMLIQSKTQISEFLASNSFSWADTMGCDPDEIQIDAENPDFYAILDAAGEAFSKYRGDMRPPLHITILNVEKANVPLEHVTKLWRTIIENEYYFGNYDFQLYAKGEEGRCVNIGRLLSR